MTFGRDEKMHGAKRLGNTGTASPIHHRCRKGYFASFYLRRIFTYIGIFILPIFLH